MSLPLSSAEASLADAFRDRGGTRLTEEEVRFTAVAADPGLLARDDSEEELVRRLRALAGAGVIRVPRSWEQSCASRERRGLPATVPRSLVVVRERGVRLSFDPRTRAWDPLRIWPWLRHHLDELLPRDYERLLAIDAWLSRHPPGGAGAVVPIEERSHEIFARAGVSSQAEKVLGSLRDNRRLFAPDRLSLDDLGCAVQPVPLTRRHVGDGDAVLVAENHAAYTSLAATIGADTGVGAVCWGAGQAFAMSVQTLADLAPRRILYVGDLDGRGLLIPVLAAREAERASLPAPEPAVALYDLLLTHGIEQRTAAYGEEAAATHAAWLASQHRERAAALLVAGRRLAQEAVGMAVLAGEESWRAALSAQLAAPASAAPPPATPLAAGSAAACL